MSGEQSVGESWENHTRNERELFPDANNPELVASTRRHPSRLTPKVTLILPVIEQPQGSSKTDEGL